MRRLFAAALATACFLAPASAPAFCGFYVSGADAELFNNATLVVMMREGTRTVLSMQNNYDGPPQDFAMVVPVPVVLSKSNVKTLPSDVFKRVDALTAPRLVEYWEQDPCPKPAGAREERFSPPAPPMLDVVSAESSGSSKHSVKIEAKFSVAEYDILILSAGDSTGLEAWLREHGYKIPPGAAPLLAPYVQMGMKFFVAKVDLQKVTRVGNRTMLSPLRFITTREAFSCRSAWAS